MRAAGPVVLGLLLALLGGALATLALRAPALSALGPGDWAAVRFSLLQASLSALLSAALAVPLARALARRRFPGRDAAIALMGAPFLLPVLVAVLGLLAVWGRAGVLNDLLAGAGLPRIDPYGLPGILIAHVFFNLPLVTRLLMLGWARVPPTHLRLARQLGFGPWATFRWIEAPMLAAVLPGAALLVFLLCMSSFAVVLALGGGPRATTIELAIYEALRFEFDLGRAVLLALLQIALSGAVAALLLSRGGRAPLGAGLGGPAARLPAVPALLRVQDAAVLVAAGLFLASPFVFVLLRGGGALLSELPAGLWAAAVTSLWVALAAAALAAGAALALGAWIARLGPRAGALAEAGGVLLLAASPFAVGTGLFVLLSRVADPFALALPVTAVLNATLALPFAVQSVVPAFRQARERFGPLADQLGMAGLARFRLVTWPLLARPLGFATGLAAALSAGDLGVIALFAPPGVETLPLYMYGLMGAYRMDDAAGAALVLLALSLGLFVALDRGLGRAARA